MSEPVSRSGRPLVAIAAVVVVAGLASVAAFALTRGGTDAGPDDDARDRRSVATRDAPTDAEASPVRSPAPSASIAVAPTTVVRTVPVTAPLVAATSTSPPTPPPTTAAPTTTLDPAIQAGITLLGLVAEDSAYVDANLTGAYVVQVNAKYLDAVDTLDGRYYDAQAILDLYDELDARYGGVVIISADDYSTKSYPGLFQMLLRQRFATQDEGKAWCTQTGLEIDDCFARGTPIGRR